MPCYDSRNDISRTEYVDNPRVSAMLCAILSVLQANGTLKSTLASADWKESGVSSQSTMEWWNNHRKADERRREFERVQKVAARKRDEVEFERLKKRLGK